jgi:chitosanase
MQPAARAQGGLTADQRRRADQIISAFENSTTQIQYGYAGNLHDGRGVTAGRAGFCTGTGDALLVVERYTGRKPGNLLARFLPELRRLARSGSDDTSRLPEADYIAAWDEETRDGAFRDVQDEVVDELYFNPAMRHADRAGLRTALARAQVYDATIQHGDGRDPDSVGALLRRAAAAARGTPAAGVGERVWLRAFFDVRVADLLDPANEETREDWAASVDRVHSMRRIADTGNHGLTGPIRFSVYGDEFVID